METINIQNKLKIYFNICNDIKILEEAKENLRVELEKHLKESGVDSLKTSVGSVSYVNTIRETLDKKFIESILTEEQKLQAYKKTESKYIKITPVKENVNLKENDKNE